VWLPGLVLLNQFAQGGLRSVLVQDSINPDLPAAPTLCVRSYPQPQFLIHHGFDLE
jgi:hypothetical protein